MPSKSGKNERRAPRAHLAAQERRRAAAGSVRIIGGEWRGRRLHFPARPGLRPTPDRIRETLFNWLQGELAGAQVLDAFAGSGALGLEALSRGAGSALFIEADAGAVQSLEATLDLLKAKARARVLRADAFQWLARQRAPDRDRYDLVLLDPPYRTGGLDELCTLLERGDWLAPRAWIYLEQAAAHTAVALPGSWAKWRSARAGAVLAVLARRAVGGEADDKPANGT